MTPQDNRKVVNMIKVRPYVHDWLVRQANQRGLDLATYIGDVLELAYTTVKGEDITEMANGDSRAQAILSYHEAERMQQLRTTVKRLAALYVEAPSERAADALEQACDASGLNYEDVIQAAQADPFSSIIAQANDKQKIDRCILWLTDFFRKNGSVENTILWAAANKQGFGKRMVGRAKLRLQEDPNTPYIDVERTNGKWMYTLKDNDGNEIRPIKPQTVFDLVDNAHINELMGFLNTGKKVTLQFVSDDE